MRQVGYNDTFIMVIEWKHESDDSYDIIGTFGV